MNRKKIVRDFILSNFLFSTKDDDLSDSISLLDSGIIDSIGVMELVEFLESTFGISVLDHEISRRNMDTVESICAYVDQKTGQTAVTAIGVDDAAR